MFIRVSTLIVSAGLTCTLACTELQNTAAPRDAGIDAADRDGGEDYRDGGTEDASQTGRDIDSSTDSSAGPGEAGPSEAGLRLDSSLGDADVIAECDDGFERDGDDCVDRDECFLDLDRCHPTATCQNMEGGYECACPPGYVGGGSTNIACSPRIAAATSYSCVVVENGRVACWGANGAGQLGDGSNDTRLEPVTVLGVSDAVAVSTGGATSCALIADGTVSCWGSNASGQLGDPELTASNRAVAIGGLDDIVSLEVGLGTTCAIASSGGVLCWGANGAGQLGDGSTSTGPTYEPVEVTGIDDARSLAVGSDFACALLNDGTVQCWGGNSWGQLGTGDMTPSTTPVQVMDVRGAVRIDAGLRHVCALLGSQRVQCWGLNTVDRVTVYDLYNATEIAVGAYHSCAAHTDRGIATCWIYPYDARPEEGAVEIDLAGNEVLALATGGDNMHACVVAQDGGVICWGANGSGQLGDGSTTTPGSGTTVQVAGIDLW